MWWLWLPYWSLTWSVTMPSPAPTSKLALPPSFWAAANEQAAENKKRAARRKLPPPPYLRLVCDHGELIPA